MTRSGLTDTEKAAIRQAAEHVIAYRDTVQSRPVTPQIGTAEVLERFWTELAEDPMPATDVIDQIVHDGEPGLMQMTSPGFFGFVVGASDPVGVAADMLVSGWGRSRLHESDADHCSD